MGGRSVSQLGRVFRDLLLPADPFDHIPDEAWAELTDPVSFVVGSMLILFYKPRGDPPAGSSRGPVFAGIAVGWRFGTTLGVAASVAIPVLVGLLFPHLGTGDAFWYAMTLVSAGAVTFVPGRLAELRDKGRVRGSGYPKKLRKAMWYCESWITLGAVILIVAWKFGGPENHAVVRAIVWGLLAVCLSEFCTLTGARNVAIMESAARTPQEEALVAGARSEPVPAAQQGESAADGSEAGSVGDAKS